MMEKNHLPRLILLSILLSTNVGKAQNNVFYNNGILQVESKTMLSSYADFTNQAQGKLVNDGMTYYFGNFTNEGNFTYTKTLATGEVKFVGTKQQNTIIAGNTTIDLHKVTFDLNQPQYYFDLKANLDIWGEVDFKDGIIKVDSAVNSTTKQPAGLISFMPKSKHKNSRDTSFIDGVVEKVGADPFVFPIGNKEYYRPAGISAPQNSKDVVLSNYVFQDSTFFKTHQAHIPEIKQLNTQEYWKLEKTKNSQTSFMLTLSWDERTTLPDVLKNPEQDLHIVHWNSANKQWEDLGGIVDMDNKKITTPANISNLGYFTLASMQESPPVEEEDVIIYNYVNANGGDQNDYFIIKNINRYPQNSVQIFNRWGAKVYETKNYDSQDNVFRGRQTKGGKLPAGTYYYLITYKKETKNTSYTIKKTGYLHLDSK